MDVFCQISLDEEEVNMLREGCCGAESTVVKGAGGEYSTNN